MADITYSTDEVNKTLTITDFAATENKNDIEIPRSFTSHGIVYSTIVVGSRAFQGKGLTSVILSDGITIIGSSAFSHNSIATISIPNSVTGIGGYAFANNTISSITFEEDCVLTSLEQSVFDNNALTTIDIPASIIRIGDATFRNNDITAVEIPAQVKYIDIAAFSQNKIATLTFANESTIEEISYDAFRDNLLDTVAMPNTVVRIGSYAFSQNLALNDFVLPSHPDLSSLGWVDEEGATYFAGDIIDNTGESVSYDIAGKGTDYFKINYSLDEGENDPENPKYYIVADGVSSFHDATKGAYTFYGWYSDAEYTTPVTEIATGSTGNTNLYAKFLMDYTITYNLDDGTNAAENPLTYNTETATITLASASKEGYTFGGWYTDNSFTTQVVEIPQGSTGHKELFAKWETISTIKNTQTNSLFIYPNPSTTFIHLSRTAIGETIKIFSASGELVLSDVITNTRINIAHLPKGIYFVKVNANTTKLLVE